MSENIANQQPGLAVGRPGTVQISDGSGQFISSTLFFNTQTGVLVANSFETSGGTIIDGSSNVIYGTPGQIAYYASNTEISGDSGLTYSNTTQTVTIGGSLVVSGDVYVSGNTYTSNSVIFNDSIVQIGNASPAFTTLGAI